MKNFFGLALTTFVAALLLFSCQKDPIETQLPEEKQAGAEKLTADCSVPVEEARTAALNFYNAHADRKIEPALLDLHPYSGPEAGEQVVYIFKCGKSGFVILSNCRDLEPVLAYNIDNPEFSSEASPEVVLDELLKQYSKEIAAFKKSPQVKKDDPNLAANRALWQGLVKGPYQKNIPDAKKISVSPLLATNWGQSGYYNDLCPTLGSSQTIVGCVAVAMGQVMRHHNYPAVGRYYNHYSWDMDDANAATNQTLIGDFGNTYYLWGQMPGVLNTSSTPAQKVTVARFLAQVGHSVNMDYGLSASGTTLTPVAPAFANNFKYNAVQYAYSNPTHAANWHAYIQNALIANKPIFYVGFGTGGHAWVLDGFNATTNKYHMNWGWDGAWNGYFSLTALNVGSYNFNSGQSMVIATPQPVTPSVNFQVKDQYGNFSSATQVTIQAGQPIILRNTGTVTGKTFFMSVQPSDAYWNRLFLGLSGPNQEKERWMTPADQMSGGFDSNLTPSILGDLNLTAFYAPNTISVGYYRVGIAVGDPWASRTVLVRVIP